MTSPVTGAFLSICGTRWLKPSTAEVANMLFPFSAAQQLATLGDDSSAQVRGRSSAQLVPSHGLKLTEPGREKRS